MVKRIKLSEVKVEPESYDAAIQEVEENDEPTEQVVEPTEQVVEASEKVVEPSEPVKMKKDKPSATCEACGKTMTLKNLKYAHHLVCPAKVKQNEKNEIITVPPKPKLVRQVAYVKPEDDKNTDEKTEEKEIEVKNEVKKEKETKKEPKKEKETKKEPKKEPKKEKELIKDEKYAAVEAAVEPFRVLAKKKLEIYNKLAQKALP